MPNDSAAMTTSWRNAGRARRLLGSSDTGSARLSPRNAPHRIAGFAGAQEDCQHRADRSRQRARQAFAVARRKDSVYNGLMDRRRLYRLLQPGNPELGGLIWRV